MAGIVCILQEMAEAEADISIGTKKFVVVQKRKIGMVSLVFFNRPT